MRAESRICVVTCKISRGDHELKTLCVGRGSAVSYMHVPSSTPLCAGSDSDLITGTIVANNSSSRMGAMTKVIAGRLCIRTTGATAGVDRVVPIEIVIGGYTIPTAILRLKRVVGPTLTSI